MFMRPRVLVAFVFTAILAASISTLHGFTQSGVGIDSIGNGIPMGHEWITRLAALEILGGDPVVPADPNDPRKSWGPKGRAKNTDLSSPGAQAEVRRLKSMPMDERRYAPVYSYIYDAIVGERWVDIGGFNVAKAKIGSYDCFDAVAQEPPEIQYDHFMRRYDDRDAAGGVQSATASQARFIQYFVAAAMAPPTRMRVWDGGGYAVLAEVDRNYFLFGRAVHLFQDSFSPEHTVRIPVDNYERVRQVKSYLCASGSEQHSHGTDPVFNYTSGDVIWLPGTRFVGSWGGYKASFMKTPALVATEATKDLWAAFIRSMGTPLPQREAAARSEAQTLVNNWLNFDRTEMLDWYTDETHRDATYVLASGQSGKGLTVGACMTALNVGTNDQLVRVAQLLRDQRTCLYNVMPEPGYSDLFDPSMHMPFNWNWTTSGAIWQQPPASWTIPNRPADTGTRVHIKSVANGQYMTAAGPIANNTVIACRAGAPLDLIMVGSPADAYYRVASAPSLFLSYNLTPGDAKLWNSPTDSNYRLDRAQTGFGIFNFRWNNYFWLNGDIPRLSGQGKIANRSAWWLIEGLQ